MTNILETIEAYKRREIAAALEAVPMAAIMARAEAQAPPRPFAEALRAKHRAGDFALIAEVKKASRPKA